MADNTAYTVVDGVDTTTGGPSSSFYEAGDIYEIVRLGVTKSEVGLTNVDNTSDANKPISAATATALLNKQPIHQNLTEISGIAGQTGDIMFRNASGWTRFPASNAGLFLKTQGVNTDPAWGAVTQTTVGLPNVNNTSDLAKPVSTAQQAALDLKANLASPAFTGTVSGITKAMVGLGNVDNTSDLAKNAAVATLTGKTISGVDNTLNVRLGSDVSGNLPVVRLNSGTSAAPDTFWAGDGVWKTVPEASGTIGGLSITRASIPTTRIPDSNFVVSGFAAAGDYGYGAPYKLGTSTGPMAIQDLAGTWFELNLVGGRAQAGWFGVKSDGAANDRVALNTSLVWANIVELPPRRTYIAGGSITMGANRVLQGRDGLRDLTEIFFDTNLGTGGAIEVGADGPGLHAGSGAIRNLVVNNRLYFDNGLSTGGGVKDIYVDGANKSQAYTAVAGDKIKTHTAGSGSWILTLPASPALNDTVEVIDGDNIWGTAGYNLSVERNGQLINSSPSNIGLSVSNGRYTFTFQGGAVGWAQTAVSNISKSITNKPAGPCIRIVKGQNFWIDNVQTKNGTRGIEVRGSSYLWMNNPQCNGFWHPSEAGLQLTEDGWAFLRSVDGETGCEQVNIISPGMGGSGYQTPVPTTVGNVTFLAYISIGPKNAIKMESCEGSVVFGGYIGGYTERLLRMVAVSAAYPVGGFRMIGTFLDCAGSEYPFLLGSTVQGGYPTQFTLSHCPIQGYGISKGILECATPPGAITSPSATNVSVSYCEAQGFYKSPFYIARAHGVTISNNKIRDWNNRGSTITDSAVTAGMVIDSESYDCWSKGNDWGGGTNDPMGPGYPPNKCQFGVVVLGANADTRKCGSRGDTFLLDMANGARVVGPNWTPDRTPIMQVFSGRLAAGAIALPGALVGDKVGGVLNLTGAADASGSFESTITVAGQIQQSNAGDLTANKYAITLGPAPGQSSS